MKTKSAVRHILDGLKAEYPEAVCSLQYSKDYELLFATRLSAQCTDARVNMVTPVLFSAFPTLDSLANAESEEIGEYIRSCGLYQTKARDIAKCARVLVSEYGGKVPDTMDELLKLPGVGRKTANLVLGDVYGKPAYVADPHCIRISGRIGLTDGTKNPASVEAQLRLVIPPEESSDFCHRLVLHGRAICTARAPECGRCPIRKYCDFGKAAK
ncbi:MAG: endonuclease III [Oscillospiraceae bacterium]|nr:endonuclease III [Oscillospiraceae bacterium]